MHIGNLRTFVFSDILFRALKYNDYEVNSVQNITDIEDKIIKRASEKNKTTAEISEEFTKYFLEDIQKLNITSPKHQPKATEYVGKMADYIKVLLEKGFAYKEDDGSIYFDISKFADYGKLSGLENRELKTGTRILSDEYTKEDVQDFALWKAVPEGEMGSFKTEGLGWGRPGWHIECSVMSQALLGDKIDIHTGGVDLIFPHHENEIAQSEAKTGQKPFVKYWIHGAHMLADGKKMSKSLGNFYTLSDLEKKGFSPLVLRYLFLQTHYRQEMNFTLEALTGARNAMDKLFKEVASFDKPSDVLPDFQSQFMDAINDDLNMPKALSVLWEVVKSDNSLGTKAATILKFDEVLGLSLIDSGSLTQKAQEMPEEVKKLLKEREQLRKEKKYEEADKIREKIIEMGYKVEDKN
jgi:cysteinyl-tRNA synthetase